MKLSTLLRSSTLVSICAAALTVVACDGEAVTFTDPNKPADESGGSTTMDSARLWYPDGGSAGTDGTDGSDDGVNQGSNATAGCQVQKVIASPLGDSGAVSYGSTLVSGDSTTMVHDGNKSFTISCFDGAEELMRVTFGPFAGFGDYPIATGNLVLHGQASDRPCELDLSDAYPAIRGFLSCPVNPHSDSNIFSLTAPPIGLGAFDVIP